MDILNEIIMWLLARYPRKVVTVGIFAVFLIVVLLYVGAGFLLFPGDWISIIAWLLIVPVVFFAIASFLFVVCAAAWEFIDSIVPDERKHKNDDTL